MGIFIACVLIFLLVVVVIRNQKNAAPSGNQGDGVPAVDYIKKQLPLVDFSNPLIAYIGDFVVLDVETTGLNKNHDEIVQFSAIRYTQLKETNRFSTYIRPTVQISSEASAVNHITNKMLRDAPAWGEVSPIICDFLGNSLLIAHNARFDISFIERQLGRELPNPFLDTLFLSQLCIPSLQNYKLATIKTFLRIKSTSHDAVGDCEAAAALFAYCLTKPELLRGHIRTK